MYFSIGIFPHYFIHASVFYPRAYNRWHCRNGNEPFGTGCGDVRFRGQREAEYRAEYPDEHDAMPDVFLPLEMEF